MCSRSHIRLVNLNARSEMSKMAFEGVCMWCIPCRHVCLPICMCIYVSMYTRTCMCQYMCICVCIYPCMSICVYVCVYVYLYQSLCSPFLLKNSFFLSWSSKSLRLLRDDARKSRIVFTSKLVDRLMWNQYLIILTYKIAVPYGSTQSNLRVPLWVGS